MPRQDAYDTQTSTPLLFSGGAPAQQDIERAVAAVETGRVHWVDLTPQHASNEYRAAVVRRLDTSDPMSRFLLLLEVEPLQLVRTLADAGFAALDGQSMLMRVQGDDVVRFAPTRGPGGGTMSFFKDVPKEGLRNAL